MLAKYPLSHFVWQVLRTAKRSKSPLTGAQLRIVPNRYSKDGTWLDGLVKAGLLTVVSVDPVPIKATETEKQKPIQFRTRYKLTEKGEHGAEYGEADFSPEERKGLKGE